ncbi:MAG: GTP-dependent dephospho-CoA kinase family protein [Thaumarchaeota archaeon]|nr:GTP-dependent dephospho-CoA kinase family protein [Nitrososphaerota archaeon]
MGLLIEDKAVTKENLAKYIPGGAFVITVGDATTEKMIKFGLEPSLQIVDSMEKRRKRGKVAGLVRTTLTCSNPASGITNESVVTIKRGLEGESPVRIEVEGEEDLLVLPAVIYAPRNSVILYGQPNEGLVVVTVNEAMRQRAREIMDLMT